MSVLPRSEPFVLPRGRALTGADLDSAPDDGHRYELVDGVLVVTPAPSFAHQRMSGRLHLLLEAARPEDMVVLYAPFDVALAEDTLLQPDLLVARRESFTARNLPTAPLLAIEILSASTRRYDVTLKRDRLEAAGCTSYWVVDPDVPSLTAWELGERGYVEVAHVSGDEEFHATVPFEMTVCPDRLLD
ncbi:MAG: Uma2 family endonuclease [Nocardioidaceae bacterium]